MPKFSSVLELSSLNGSNGFKISGQAEFEYSGVSVSDAGDINGDGIDDIVIGAIGASPNGSSSGATYVVFGTSDGFDVELELSSLDGTNGFKINGEAAYDFSGLSEAAGDINGDGIDDLVISARLAGPNGNASGASYVIFGSATPFQSEFELSDLDGANGFKINGEAIGDESGVSVSGAGDINGDGFDDLVIGANRADPNGRSSAGATYVVFGSEDPFQSTLELSSLNGANGFQINGVATSDQSGISVSRAGDVNGDGIDDLIIGAHNADPNSRSNSGATYVVFGSQEPFGADLNLSTLDGSNGFRINGETAQDLSGFSVSAAGDFNGDGIADIVIGARGADPNGKSSAGATYVVFGSREPFGGNLNLSALDGSNGFQINGEVASDLSGFSVSAAGDINGDGFDDIIIGAYAASPNGTRSGASYVVFGSDSDFGATLELSNLDGTTGFKLNGVAASDLSGQSVSGAGDVNGDGFDDIIIGANGASPTENNSGASYVVFGMPLNAVPSATNLTQTKTFVEDAGAVALDDIEVSNPETDETVTATLTLSNPLAGSLSTSGAATYTADTGVWTITGTVAEVNAALAAVSFMPAADWNQGVTIATRIRDAADAGPADGTITLTAAGVNDAPTLSGAGTLAAVDEDTASPAGAALSSLGLTAADLDGTVTGYAVVGNTATPSQGTWQYSTNGGTHWHAIGEVSDGASALAFSAATLVRFVPASDYKGTPGSLTVRALDDTYSGGFSASGSAESRVTIDTTATGGTSSISSSSASIGTSITSVNDDPAGQDDSFNLNEDDEATPLDVLANDSIDPDAGETLTITAVTQPKTGGTVTLDGGQVLFTPEADFNGTATFTYTVSDGNGGEDVRTVTVDVEPVNDAPSVVTLIDLVSLTPEGGVAVKVADITIEDDEQGTETLSLIGADASSFEIRNGTELWFRGGADFETKTSHAVQVKATDEDGLSATSGIFTLSVGDLSDTPTGGDDDLTTGSGDNRIDGQDGGDRIDGGAGNDNVRGSGGDDTLLGGDGHDILRGNDGNDRLNGGAGDDVLKGGLGADVLLGGEGADRFVFSGWRDSPAEGFDRIVDFSRGQGDKLDLSGLGGLSWLGDRGFTGAGDELRFEQRRGDTFVLADLDGDGQAEFKLKLDRLMDLKLGDFIL
jgi:Ca2+-binding RTX toxin-like protein